jgi:hypothetical protein
MSLMVFLVMICLSVRESNGADSIMFHALDYRARPTATTWRSHFHNDRRKMLAGLSRLSIVPWPYLLEQIVAQGVIAGVLAWIGFLYAARILGLVTASFMPAMTPAVASLIALGITRESPTVLQWLLIALGTIGAALLITSLHARRTVPTET